MINYISKFGYLECICDITNAQYILALIVIITQLGLTPSPSSCSHTKMLEKIPVGN